MVIIPRGALIPGGFFLARTGRTRDTPSIAVVGAGFGGLGTAVRLRQAGFRDLTLFERCADLGSACLAPSPDHLCSGVTGEAPAPAWRHPASPRALLAAAGMRRQLRACA